MFKKLILAFFILSACAAQEKPIVLDYDDFGPQALSYKTIGFGWYKWNSHGSKEKHNIKVVIVKNEKSFAFNEYQDSQSSPVVDYRMISYKSALEYLNQSIEELSQTNEFPEIIQQLKLTKRKIEAE